MLCESDLQPAIYSLNSMQHVAYVHVKHSTMPGTAPLG